MSEENSTAEENSAIDEEFDVIYRCLRCGNESILSELNRLPEIKCICGFRVFTKERPGLVKSVKAI